MEKAKKFVQANAVYILAAAIILYIIVFSLLCLWKYYNFYYDLMDLAIFNQVFFNTAQGRFFASTIQQSNYLGDHFSPVLFLLLPFYAVFKSPLTLLFLQTLLLGLSSWPVYLIAKNTLGRLWALFFALAFLANPITANINLFEFELLPLAIFFLLWTIYFYKKNNFWAFIFFMLLSLTVREDVSLFAVMFSALALIEKKNIRWIFFPAVIAVTYFILSIEIISYFSPADSYKFLTYYSWLGGNFLGIVKNSFLKFHLVLLQLFSPGDLEMIFGFLLIFAFLPLFSPRHLILAALIFVQYVLSRQANGLIFRTHYASLFVPALWLSSIYGLNNFFKKEYRNKFIKILQQEKNLAFIILFVTVFYSYFALGPIAAVAKKMSSEGVISKTARLKNEYVKKVSPAFTVISSYEFLPRLSSRKNIYSLNYILADHLQFSKKKYEINKPVDLILADREEISRLYIEYTQRYNEPLNFENIEQVIKENGLALTNHSNGLMLYEKSKNKDHVISKGYEKLPDDLVRVPDNEYLMGYKTTPDRGIEIYWLTKFLADDNFLQIRDGQNLKIYPIPKNDSRIIRTDFKFFPETGQITVNLIKLKGEITLSGILSSEFINYNQSIAGPWQIQLPTN